MASGIGVLVMSLTTVESLEETAIAYYERYGFAHVFAHVERAPEHLRDRLREIPGVRTVETRVVRTAVLDIEGFDEPVIGRLVSVPERHEPQLNRLALRQGRYPRLGAPDEAVLTEPFAQAHGLEVGDKLRAIINSRWRVLTVVGIALSPEYVYAIGPGALMPDDQRFGVLWMGHEALQAAYRPRRRVQRRQPRAAAGHGPGVRGRSRRPPARALRRRRRVRAGRPDLELVPDERDRAASDALDHPADRLPGRGGVPHAHGDGSADRGRAQRDRPAEGVRLPQPRHRAALHALRARHRRRRRAARLVRRVLARPVPHAPVRRVLPLPVPAFPAERDSRSCWPAS